MAFDLRFWGHVSTTGNSSFYVNPDGTGTLEGPPSVYSYSSDTDNISDILAANYFSHSAILADVKFKDVIFVAGRNADRTVVVDDINYNTGFISVVPASDAGNVTNFTGGVASNLPIFADNTGTVLIDSGISLGDIPTGFEAFQSSLRPNSLLDPHIVLKGIEGIEFRDLHGFLWVSDGLDAFGIIGLNANNGTGQRQVLITDGSASLPTTQDAVLELATDKGALLLSRLTTTNYTDLADPKDGMIWYDSTEQQMSWRAAGTVESPIISLENGPNIDVFLSTNPKRYTMELTSTGVIAATYTLPTISVDGRGRITAASNGSAVTSITNSSEITSSGGSTPSLSLSTTGVVVGAHAYPSSLTVDSKGRLTSITDGSAPVASVSGTSPINSTGGTTPVLSLNNSGVTAATYVWPSLAIDAHGLVTSASNGTLTAGAGLSSTGSYPNITLSIATTGVAAGQYFGGAITFNTLGQSTNALVTHCGLSNYDTNQTIGPGADVPIVFDGTNQVTCDAGGWHSNSVNNTRITPGVIGHFEVFISARVNDSATATYFVCSLLRNGVADLNTQAQMVEAKGVTNSMNTSFSVMVQTQLITDYFELSVRHNSSVNQSLTMACINVRRCG